MAKDLPSWSALAIALGYSTRSLHKWRALDGAPKTPNQEAWEAFAASQGLGSGGKHSSLEDLKAERLRKQIELDQIKIDQQKRLIIPADELDSFLGGLATMSRAAVYAALETELPPKLEGQSVVKIRKLCRESADSICDRMQAEFTKWAKDHKPE